jgi:hypothetical protein
MREKYCPRGEMENRFQEQQLELFSDRTSTHTFAGNQLRLWFSSIAYVLMNALRNKCLAKTELGFVGFHFVQPNLRYFVVLGLTEKYWIRS